MADRLLALVGSGKGPVLRTARMKRPILHITSLSAEFEVNVKLEDRQLQFTQPGKYDLQETDWVEVQASGNCSSLICTIHEGK